MSVEINAFRRNVALEAFGDADHQRDRRIRQAMVLVTNAPDGSFTPLEKMVLVTSGSITEMEKYKALSEKIKAAHGEPMLLARFRHKAERGWNRDVRIGKIDTPPRAELAGHLGYLYIKLANKQEWYNSVLEVPHSSEEERLFTFTRNDDPTDIIGARFTYQAIQEYQHMLIGRGEIAADETAHKWMSREVNTFYEQNY